MEAWPWRGESEKDIFSSIQLGGFLVKLTNMENITQNLIEPRRSGFKKFLIYFGIPIFLAILFLVFYFLSCVSACNKFGCPSCFPTIYFFLNCLVLGFYLFRIALVIFRRVKTGQWKISTLDKIFIGIITLLLLL